MILQGDIPKNGVSQKLEMEDVHIHDHGHRNIASKLRAIESLPRDVKGRVLEWRKRSLPL